MKFSFCRSLLRLAGWLGVVVVAPFAALGEESPREIVCGADHFEFVCRATLPPLERAGRLLLPLAKSGEFQTVESAVIDSPLPYRQIEDRAYHNAILEFSPTPDDSGKIIEIRYRAQRREKTAHPAESGDNPQKYLAPERLVPTNAIFKTIAAAALQGVAPSDETTRARALYNRVLSSMRYDKTGVGWGQGDALRACDARAGNCADFHSYFIALARAAGIPSRFAIGATIPADKDEGVIAGYHCWAEFFAEGKWMPVDISEAWNHPALKEYYFGSQPANRFEFSVGRDLIVDPPTADGSLNFLVYPYLESDGKKVNVPVAFSFHRLPAAAAPPAGADAKSTTAAAVAP